MNVYSTFDVPRFYYFISHLPLLEGALARQSTDTIPIARVLWTHGLPASVNWRILPALGVRYVVFQSPVGEETLYQLPDGAVLLRKLGPATVGGGKLTHTIYGYNDTNAGNYSPTNVVIARDAPSMLKHFWRTSFDPRQSVVLSEGIEEPLVQATSGKMFFERGAIRVQAESHGHSLLLLPLQYSRCLVLSEGVKAKLLPANLVQTVVLFEGNIDLRIYFEYGLFRPGCRRQDLADLAELGIFDEKGVGPPWAQLHPYAISTVADLSRALGAVVTKLTRSR